MKAKAIFLIIFVSLFLSCDFEVPKKVSVKTDANFALNVGEFSQSLSEYVNVSEITKQMNGSLADDSAMKMKVYDYNPENKSDIQKFLIDVPIQDIPIDMGQYLEKIDFNSTFEAVSFEKTLDFKEYSEKKFTQNLEFLNLRENILGAEFESVDITVPDAGNELTVPLKGSIPVNFAVKEPSFAAMKFNNGKLLFNIKPKDKNEGFDLIVKKISLISASNGSVINTVEYPSLPIGTRKEIEMDISGKQIEGKLKLEIEGDVQCSASIKEDTKYSLSASISEDSQIHSVTGLTYKFEKTQTVKQKMDFDSSVEECKIGSGAIKTKAYVPSGWTNVSFSVGDKDLSDTVIKNGDNLDLSISFSFEFKNSTITFDSEGKVPPIKVESVLKISKFEYIILKTAEYFSSLGSDFNKQFPDEVQNYVKWFKLAPSGLQITYTNTLPEGNDITVCVKSDMMDIKDGENAVEKNLVAGPAQKNKLVEFLGNYGAVDSLTYFKSDEDDTVLKEIPTSSNLDLNVKMKLPVPEGKTEEYAKLSNIDLTKAYAVGVNIKPTIDWYSVCLKKIDGDMEGNIATDFSYDSLFKEFAKVFGDDDHFFKNLKIASLPLYLYFTRPSDDAFESVSVSGKINLSGETGSPIYVLGKADSDGVLTAVEQIPELIKDKNQVVINDIAKMPTSVESVQLSELFAPGVGKLKFTYDLGIASSIADGIEVKKNSGASGSISIYARMVMPFDFAVLEDASAGHLDSGDSFVDIIAVANMYDDAGNQKDLFSRSEATDMSKVEEYTKIIKSVGLLYKIDNGLFSPSSRVELLLADPESKFLRDKYTMYMKGGSIEIERDDFYEWMKTYPFTPSVKAIIPKNSRIMVPRDAQFKINLSVTADCDENEQLDLF